MENSDITAYIAAAVSLIGIFIQWYRSRSEGIGAIAEGYDRLAPHLTKRIDELEKKVKDKGKDLDQANNRIAALEDRDEKRMKGIRAVAGYLQQSENLINQSAEMLREGLSLLEKFE